MNIAPDYWKLPPPEPWTEKSLKRHDGEVPDYVTVYQISRQPSIVPEWLVEFAGLLPFIVAAVIIFGKYRLRWRRPGWVVPLFLCFFGVVLFYVVVPLSSGVSQMDAEALRTFETGHFSVVEGIVADFHPMPYEGHQDECFSVSSHRFCYSDYTIVPGFRNTATHGGPIRAGLRVRISYSFGTILRLEVAKDQALSQEQLTAAAKSAESDWLHRAENDPIQQRMTIAFLFTAMCWTLWWTLQWKRAMRFWVKPPNRPITQYAFRIFFALNFLGAVRELFRQLRLHPLTMQSAGPAVATAAIMLCAVGSMTAAVLWLAERRDRRTEGAGSDRT